MRIVCLRTGRTLVADLSASDATATMERRIREACAESRITSENTDRIVANYRKTGFHPFMFDVVSDTSRKHTDGVCWCMLPFYFKGIA